MRELLSKAVSLLTGIGMMLVSSAAAHGEVAPVRPVNSSWMLEAGSSHLADTYLSPLKYTGWNAAFEYERIQAMKFRPEIWRQELNVGMEVNRAENPAGNNSMLYANISARWGMLRIWQMPHGLFLAGGGSAGGNIGGLYNGRNGNNPAAVKADLTVNLTGWAGWNTRIGRMPVMLRWQTMLPVAGAFFSPEYDELYYEIYLGNHGGLAHFAWPGNFFRWDNLVTADLDFATTRLRLGFRSRIFSTEVNHITTRIFSYAFVLGVTGDWFSVSRSRPGVSPETARIIYAY